MPHSYNKIWVHAICATKERQSLINFEIEARVYGHIKGQLIEMGCPVKIINGMQDHVHILFLLSPQKSIADVLKQLKGNTSHWINELDIIKEKFSWQVGYAAYSVSESQLEKVSDYIANQKQHHNKKTFSEEFDEFIKLHGFNSGE